MTKITKTEAAALLDKTPRAVERYAASGRLSVTYEKGKTRDTPVYDRAEVEALADELRQPATPARGAIATRGDNNDGGVSQGVAIPPSQALERQTSAEGMAMLDPALADALRAALASRIAVPAPSLLLTIPDAAAWLGVSKYQLELAIGDGKLSAPKIGRGRRVRPEDLLQLKDELFAAAKKRKLLDGLKVRDKR